MSEVVLNKRNNKHHNNKSERWKFIKSSSESSHVVQQGEKHDLQII